MEGIGSPGSSSSSSIEVDPPVEDDLPIEVDPPVEEVAPAPAAAPVEEVAPAPAAAPMRAFVPIINLDLPLGDFLQALVDARAWERFPGVFEDSILREPGWKDEPER